MKRHHAIVVKAIAAAVVVSLLFTLTGCDPSKRLFRFCHRHPELCARDTIRDTVWATVEYVGKDTVFLPVPGDTVTIEQDRLRVRYVLMAGDTVWIEGECLADTIAVPYEVVTEVMKPVVTNVIPWWVWAVVGALALVALVGLLRR
jgi:hypothetical protein